MEGVDSCEGAAVRSQASGRDGVYWYQNIRLPISHARPANMCGWCLRSVNWRVWVKRGTRRITAFADSMRAACSVVRGIGAMTRIGLPVVVIRGKFGWCPKMNEIITERLNA